MRKAINKDFFREIKFTLNRYLSILFIVALGVAFFAGIRATCPDMKLTLDNYLDETSYMDIRVISTLGLTDEDIEAIEDIEGVSAVDAAYSYDAFVIRDDEKRTLRFLSEPDGVNEMDIIDGRGIESEDECVVDSFLITKYGYAIGDTIEVTAAGEDEDVFDTLSRNTYTIVGVCTSSSYFTVSRDTVSIGTGESDAFVYLSKSVFVTEAYSAAYILVEDAYDAVAYSDEYEDIVDAVTERLEDISGEREAARYDGILADANEEIDEAREELADAREEADAELADAWAQIVDGEQEIADGEQELADGRASYDEQIADAEAELAAGQKEIDDGEAEIAANEKTLSAAAAQIAAAEQTLADSADELAEGWASYESRLAQANAAQEQLDDAYTQIAAAESELDTQEAALNAQKDELLTQQETSEAALASIESGVAQLNAAIEALDAQKASTTDETELAAIEEQLTAANESLSELQTQQAALEAALPQIESGLEQIDAGLQEIANGREEIETQTAALNEQQAILTASFEELAAAKETLEASEAELAAGQTELNTQKASLESGQSALAAAKAELAAGQAEVDAGRQELEEQKASAEAEFAEAEQKLEDAKAELEEAKQEYADGELEAEEELADAEQKILDAEAELEDLDYPEWYVLDRNSTLGYVEYGQNAERIDAIGKVFPVIFFLVAALISLTTMTRMVESERTQIGTLKALGYRNWTIARKYVYYALSASAIGSVIGILFGETFLPWVIITTYKILYPNLPVVLTPLNVKYSIMASAAAIICVTGAAFASCYRELVASAAELMRPVAPKVGKKVWLEHIRFIWERLNFSNKVAVRNLFRYKKRFYMTIFGISGCTALVVFGFGLTDSISGVVPKQYDELFHYDMTLTLDDNATDEDMEALYAYLDGNDLMDVEDYVLVRSKSIEVQGEEAAYTAYLTVPEDTESYTDFVVFQERKSGEPYTLDDETVIITEKLSDLLNLKAGDTLVIEDGDQEAELTVGAVAENYLMSYIYISPALYETAFGAAPEWNTIQAFISDLNDDTSEAYSEALLSLDAVSATTTTDYTRGKFEEALGSLEVITLIVVAAAGMLAFIVLYNLNNINITERRRELATIKVLGFHDPEVAAYVYRENVMLTVIGVLLGIVIGKYLHAFIITTVETDTIMFIRHAEISSYIYAVLLTFVFALFVNWLMYYRLKKIDMVESMKSVE